jgi:hypothetical protein
VAGTLNRAEYFEQFFGGRFLIHPFAQRYHNQYTNVEAVAAGMPVLFRTDNPLYLEQNSDEVLAHPPEWIGAFQSEKDLLQAAEEYYHQPERLAELASRQALLLQPFCRDYVLAEARRLLQLLRPATRADESPTKCASPYAMIPCAAAVELQQTFHEYSERVPLHAFAIERDWQLLAMGHCELPVLRVPPDSQPQRIVVGQKTPVPPGVYDLELRGYSHADTMVVGTPSIHLPIGRGPAARIVVSAVGPFVLRANLETTERCAIVIEIESFGTGAVELESVALLRRSEQAKAMVASSPDSGWEQFKSGQWTKVVAFECSGLSPIRRADAAEVGLKVSREEGPVKVFLGNVRQPMPVGYALGLEIDAEQTGRMEIGLSAWNEKKVVGRASFDAALRAGRNFVPVASPVLSANSDGRAVLSLQAETDCEAFLIGLRLVPEAKRRPSALANKRRLVVQRRKLATKRRLVNKKKRVNKQRIASKRRLAKKQRTVKMRRLAARQRRIAATIPRDKSNLFRRLLRKLKNIAPRRSA